MDLERYTKDPIVMTNVIFTVFFLISFPVYFGIASDVDEDSLASLGGVSGKWMVSFAEDIPAQGHETVYIDDGTTETFEFNVDIEDSDVWLSVLWITIEYDETDEGGQAQDQCDEVVAEVDPSSLSGYVESGSIMSGSSDNCDNIVLQIILKEGYTGDSFEHDGTIEEVVDEWAETDANGRGLFSVDVVVNENHGEISPFLQNNDGGEEVEVLWQVNSYELEFTPVIEEEPV